MEDCITISDDEDVQLIKHVVNLEPIIIDLTRSDETSRITEHSKQPHGNSPYSQQPSPPEYQSQPEPQSQPQPEPQLESQSQPWLQPQPQPQPQPQAQAQAQAQPQPQAQPQAQPQPQPQPQPQFQPQTQTKPQQQSEAQPQPQEQTNFLLKSRPQPQPHTRLQPQPHAWPQPQEQANPQLKPQYQSQPDPQPKQSIPKPVQKPYLSDHDLMVAQKALGNEKYKNNLFDDAIRTYKRANELAKKLENNEMSAILHFNLAMTYYKLGSFDQAADECANAVKINDKYIKAHLKRAEIYQRQCKFEEAVICYEYICELDSTNQDYAILLNHAKEAAKHTKKRDYYQILGLNSNFTPQDLKRAYRQQALSHHPDRHSDADIVTKRIQEKHFKDASEAHTFIQLRLGYRR